MKTNYFELEFSAMAKHIKNKEADIQVFERFSEAYNEYIKLCEKYNLNNYTKITDLNHKEYKISKPLVEAGGIGYDYRCELNYKSN